jgi:ribosomal-protein-alanine N-acetyltransferase
MASIEATQFVTLSHDHLTALIEIETACHYSPMSESLLASCLGGRYFSFGLMQNSQLVGFYIGENVSGDITLMDICVAPSAQGNGFANLLLEHFLLEAKNRHGEQVFLEVRESNERAIKLYEKHDFAEIGIRKNYYPSANGKEHALLMAKSLLD